MTVYKMIKVDETKCFQQKYVYPGIVIWEDIKKEIVMFLKGKKYMYNGGWAIHHFLKSLNKGLKIYDEDDICDSTDFDMFGPSPAEDLISLGDHLKKKFPELSFTINNGMHPNQYVIIINFMGAKMVDWIYIAPKAFKYLPSVTYEDGTVCLHPLVELLRQYNMLSNVYLMAPDKDISKALKRISLLEKYALEPWLKESSLWDMRKVKDMDCYPEKVSRSNPKTKMLVEWQTQLVNKWMSTQKYLASVGHLAFLDIVKSLKPRTKKLSKKASTIHSTLQGVECVVHDAVFGKCVTNLIQFIRGLCKEFNFPQQNVDLVQYEPFMAVVGPLYNGWVEVKVEGVIIFRLYSLATPVHVNGEDSKHASYFFNMAHIMWRALYLRYQKEETEAKFHDMMVATLYKLRVNHIDSPVFTLNLKKETTLGVIPVRNFYMMNNKLRSQKIGFFRYVCDDQGDTGKKVKPTEFYYKHFEGKVVSRTYLNRVMGNKLPELPYLYERMKSSPTLRQK